jgi:hypothetical protein
MLKRVVLGFTRVHPSRRDLPCRRIARSPVQPGCG